MRGAVSLGSNHPEIPDGCQASARGGYVVVGPPGGQGMVCVQGRYRGGAWSVRLGDVALSAGDARRVAAMLLYVAGDAT